MSIEYRVYGVYSFPIVNFILSPWRQGEEGLAIYVVPVQLTLYRVPRQAL